MSHKILQGFLFIAAMTFFVASQSLAWASDIAPNIWHDLPIGGGGYLTGSDMSADGFMVVRADVYNGYILDTTSSTPTWTKLFTPRSLPNSWIVPSAGNFLSKTDVGVQEVRFAPSQPKTMYAIWAGYLWSSVNRGAAWSGPLGCWAEQIHNVSDTTRYKFLAEKIAVDPADPNIILAGNTTDGTLLRSTNGGSSCMTLGGGLAAPTEANGAYSGIAFDPSTAVGGVTQRIYASPYDKGLYTSADAGRTWTAVSGCPSVIRTGKVYAGAYYSIGIDGSDLFKFAPGDSGCSSILSAPAHNRIAAFDFDPLAANHMVVTLFRCAAGGMISGTLSGGKWTFGDANTCTGSAPTGAVWQGNVIVPYINASNFWFDRHVANKFWISANSGAWETTQADYAAQTNWVNQSVGIEELVSLFVTVPPGCKQPVTGSWDHNVFQFPSNETAPTTNASNGPKIYAAWGLDYASSLPSTVLWSGDGLYANAASTSVIYKSTQCGQAGTWTSVPIPPIDYTNQLLREGIIAVSTPENFIVNYSQSPPFYTTDGGSTWHHVSLASATPVSSVAATTAATATSPSGAPTLRVASCSKAISGETVWDIKNTLPVKIGQIFSCSGATLMLNAPSLANVMNGDGLVFNGVADPVSTKASGSWAVGGTIPVSSCSGIYARSSVLDYTYPHPKSVGVVASCSGGTITLAPRGALVASIGSTDDLYVSLYGNTSNSLINPFGRANYRTIAADRVISGVFYIMLASTTISGPAPKTSWSGIYIVSNGGATVAFSGPYGFGFNQGAQLKATPGRAGDLWVAGGLVRGVKVAHPAKSELFHSTDGGRTFTQISPALVRDPSCVGFGAPAPGQRYPAIYTAAWGNGDTSISGYGVWRSVNGGSTWTKIGASPPLDNMSSVRDCTGDMSNYGYAYVALINQGFGWGYFPYLLNRDLHHDNDNSPAFLEKAG